IASRLADDAQSMVQRRALGDAHAFVPAHHRVPLAGGAHGARHARGSRTRNAYDARSVPPVRRGVPGDPADSGTQERGRAIPGRGRDLFDRGLDGRRARAAMRHLAFSRPELREAVRDPLPRRSKSDAVRVADELAGIRARIDDREGLTPGFKFNDWEMRGVPVRIEIGPRDVASGEAVLARRDK